MTQVSPQLKIATRSEFVEGVCIELPPENRLHQKIVSFLFAAFVKLGVSTDLVVVGLQIVISDKPATVRQPDLTILSEKSEAALTGLVVSVLHFRMPPPVIVVEVVSLGDIGSDNYERDYVEKPREYGGRGITEYWQIDPDRAVVAVLSLNDGVYRSREFRGSDFVISPTFSSLNLTAAQILRAGR